MERAGYFSRKTRFALDRTRRVEDGRKAGVGEMAHLGGTQKAGRQRRLSTAVAILSCKLVR
jgi:hypothetical protein